MSTEDVITQFQVSPIQKTLAIRGGWGRGKTHLWKQLIKSNKTKIAWETYSYVSLFGVNSLQELKTAIFEKGVKPADAHVEEKVFSFDTTVSELPTFAKQNAKPITRAIFNIQTPWAGGLGAIYEAYVFSKVRKRLVCFDDLERRGKNLSMEDVLGLISMLCEERLCSVALILNEETLEEPDQKIWRRYREKVFDGEVTYRPSTAGCIDKVLMPVGQDVWHDEARNVFMRANVSNIRIISRAKRCIDQIKDQVGEKVSKRTKEEFAKSAAILTYCHNAEGENAPTIEFAMQHSLYAGLDDNEEKSPQDKAWARILDDLNFTPSDLDPVVADLVVHGYPDKDEFKRVSENIEAQMGKANADEKFSEAWNFYHNSFGDDGEELVAKFRNSFPGAASFVSANNANSTMLLMRDLGETELAEQFADLWIESRRGERKGELTLREAELFGRISDTYFREKLIEAGKKEHAVPSFDEAMTALSDRDGNFVAAYETLAEAEIEEYIRWLKDTKGGKLSSAIGACLQPYPGENAMKARAKLRTAMFEISKETMIDQVRMMRYGIIDKSGEFIPE